ncbi:hypothetical protein [Portibacter lacus]|uniref:Lipoprotein n=1 Tax=Portibacter lacus TaxID=1099794 RepID=A0AA37WEN2_9BACT|nr:hypothetical protein [Portibacter lacus]GLR16260.1 hypothetical protein GCM10007940_08750 [Portibacter lacus]
MRAFLITSVFFIYLFSVSCNNSGEAKIDTSAFDAAYPEMWTELGLPQYRRGTLKGVEGINEGVKTIHSFTIESDDPPSFLREFFQPNIKDLGWKDLQARRRISDIHEDDLYFASYVKGKNKLEINASALPQGGSKTKIKLSVFNK